MEGTNTIIPDVNRMGKADLAAYLSVAIVVSIATIMANMFLITAILRLKKLRSIPFRFVFCLSVSDTSIGLMQLSSAILSISIREKRVFRLFKLGEQLTAMAFETFTICMIVTITMDRYLHMKHLLRYNLVMTTRRANIIVLINICASITVALIFLFLSIYTPYVKTACLVYTIAGYIALVAVIMLYFRSYFAIRTRIANFTNENVIQRSRRQNEEFTRMMLFILTSLIVCYVPGSIYVVYTTVAGQQALVGRVQFGTTLNWLYTLMCLNSAVNAVNFVAFSQELRSYTKRFFRNTNNI